MMSSIFLEIGARLAAGALRIMGVAIRKELARAEWRAFEKYTDQEIRSGRPGSLGRIRRRLRELRARNKG